MIIILEDDRHLFANKVSATIAFILNREFKCIEIYTQVPSFSTLPRWRLFGSYHNPSAFCNVKFGGMTIYDAMGDSEFATAIDYFWHDLGF